MFLLAPLIGKQILGEDELLNTHGHLVVTGVHFQLGGKGGAEGSHIDTAMETTTGGVHMTGDGLSGQGGQGRLQRQGTSYKKTPITCIVSFYLNKRIKYKVYGK